MESTNQWRIQRQVSVSVLVQLITLAGLILGSWVNLQRQLDIVSHDVKQLLTAQEKFCDKLEGLAGTDDRAGVSVADGRTKAERRE